VNPNVDSILMAQVNMLGKHVVADLQQQGFKGVVTGMRFNAFFEGTMSKTPLWHNMVGILSEMASVRIATPLFLPRGSLGRYGSETSRYSRVTDFLDPWPGGWWRLRDIIDYEKALTYSLLDLAATYKEQLVMNFYTLNRKAIEKGKQVPPFAYIISLDQHDPNSASEMLKRLQLNGARIYRCESPFTYQQRNFPAGTFVIPLSQPCRPCIKDLLEPQKYPDLKQYPGGPPAPPYDVTGWTLHLQMGVDIVPLMQHLKLQLLQTEKFDFNSTGIVSLSRSATTYLIEGRYNHSFTAVNELLKRKFPVYRSKREIIVGEKTFPAGTFIIPAVKNLAPVLQSLSDSFDVPVYGVPGVPLTSGSRQMSPRLGLYHPWTASMDEGWTRLVLDAFRFSYKKLHNAELRSGKLNEKFDVIILPDLTIPAIIEGRRRWDPKEPFLNTPLLPEKYRGGIGGTGVAALIAFVRGGGTLITFGEACNFAMEKLRVPAENVIKGCSRSEFYSPGSLLEVELDTSQPLAYGLPGSVAIRMTNSPVFRLLPHTKESKAIGYYGEDDPLLSGWLIGADKLAGKTALAEIPIEKGRVILFGFRVQSRAKTHGTFKLLFNAILTSRNSLKP
jgi:hypothetical protein